MATFQPTRTFLYPRASGKKTPDSLYWKNLEFPVTKKEHGAVTHIEFSTVAPYNYAVTSSAKVEVVDRRTLQTVKTLRHFRQSAYGGSYRRDGQLLVAGGDEPVVQLFDVTQKKLDLKRNFKGHRAPVHLTRFTTDDVHLFSGSDDKTVRLWDISTESETMCFTDHQDYVRCGVNSPASRDVLVTGSYDHTVRLFDLRSKSSVLSIDHGYPVESVLVFPGGGLVASAGDNYIKIWDILSGGRLLTSLSSHHKTVTSLCFCSSNQRLVSASLDRHVKFYDINSYQVVHTLDYPSAILTVAIAPDDSLLAVGMADGLLSIQRRKDEKQTAAKLQKAKLKKRATESRYRFHVPTVSYTAAKEDTVVKRNRRPKLAPYDKFFKSYQYSKALDEAMKLQVRRKSPELTIAIMKELIRRRSLKTSLAGRDERSVRIILKFLVSNMHDQRFRSTVLDIIEMMIDLYEDQILSSPVVRDMFREIQFVFNAEKELATGSMELLGALDTIMSASTASS